MAEDKKENSAKRRAVLNYLLSQIFGNEDYSELQQKLIEMDQPDPFIEEKPKEPEMINYPGFTGKRFTALQSKIAKHNEPNEEIIPDATGRQE